MAKKHEGVIYVSRDQTRKRLTRARLALQREIQLVKDLLFLKSHAKLTPQQDVAVETSLRAASDIVALYAEQYGQAAIEMIASNTK